ncbi:hypothetical protein E2C01_065106 [Portunus trituberculatus]|uniref:Uncharacterized protein n=1 Tax=Portunus trituberculatus TaxID=210409 RepID=A0A5B7HMK5_PORTR|nr:hypothetical protein [Portunus trituberculatus]
MEVWMELVWCRAVGRKEGCSWHITTLHTLTSGAGRPPELSQTRVIGTPAVALRAAGKRTGGSGATWTVRRAARERIPGTPSLALTWHWYSPSSRRLTG